MKKFILAVAFLLAVLFFLDTAYYKWGFYIDFHPDDPISVFTKTEGKTLQIDRGNGYENFIVKGVNMGSGEPGQWSTDFAIDEETYYRWFCYMQEMGINTLRVYTIQADDFYRAFYNYNMEHADNPLYMIHGVWINDYIQNSHRDAYDKLFVDKFLESCRTMIDVVHGAKKISLRSMDASGSGTYNRDISPWVIGYILGVEWEDVTAIYTDKKYENTDGYSSYSGTYMYTSQEASPFEAMLAMVGDKVIAYETDRYRQQRLIAFSNWPTTDPFDYPYKIEYFFKKCANIDMEHILTTDNFLSGQFASYHVYPYYPDYLTYIDDLSELGITDTSKFKTPKGKLNTYKLYLSLLEKHHTMPVVISEFGVSTGRGMAQKDQNTNRNQGHMSEKEQGQALIDCWKDIRAAGCAGGCVFTWQDEWFKRTWNTMHAVDLKRTPYWSDYQTNEQYFGLLSYDPGKDKSICYVDGDISEWREKDIVWQQDNNSVSMKYDEKFLYFLIHKEGLDFKKEKLYLPLDVTPKTGSTYCQSTRLKFERACDFLITIAGENNSRVQVQKRYDALRSTYSENVYEIDCYIAQNTPLPDTPEFVNIDMILQTATPLLYSDNTAPAEVYETGELRYGNANPESADFDSLADFICEGDYIELKLPWQLLNFADPSKMMIHDDYYDGNYGVEYMHIKEIYLGLGIDSQEQRIRMSPFALKGWGNDVTYHERLKSSYYILKDYWTKN